MTAEELKTQLRAEAEGIIHEMVGQEEASQPRTLNELEQAAPKAGQQVKASGLAGLVSNAHTCQRGICALSVAGS
jgi:hypothetical protein